LAMTTEPSPTAESKNSAPATQPLASDDIANFADIRRRFEESMLKESCTLNAPEYVDMKALADSASQSVVPRMKEELDAVASECQIIEAHDDRSDELLRTLRTKLETAAR
jgi:hypothetical protein